MSVELKDLQAVKDVEEFRELIDQWLVQAGKA